MDNQPKIGCRFGTGTGDRTKIIDPNAFYGETNSSRNIPVRIEDLTISVKLTTTKKSRTTIATSEDENTVVKEQKGATINFIEGSDINGKKVLTTKYTQLTTVFDKDEFNPETFGITNIDIDYNTSYTPVIKIDFVDVKGSSIFQNEESLTQDNSQNKYTTFFEFPYPMFELEVKGYYGQPVTYCLHMTKFNSKFNSQTGNFEISCEFIGYTYALLSDMLVGVLKVIHLTNIGGTIFNNYNTERTDKGKQPILNLVELRKKIADISEEIQKAAATSSESKDIVSFQESNNLLSSLNLNLANLNDQFSITKKDNTTETTEYSFVVMDNTPFSNEKNANYNAINAEIKETIKKYNDLKINGLSINENEFASPTIITELTLDKLEPDYDLQIGIYKDASEIESFKKDLKNYIKNNFNLASNVTFRAFDLRSRYKILEIQKSLSETSLKDANRALAIQIKDKVAVTLGFEPTVRNMVEIFTNLIEVFMETIWTVSNKAENNVIRKELLKTAFGQDLNKSDYTEKINYWPWPDYREKDSKTNAYVDTYLGSCPELKNNISDIDELVFIDDLLKAFLTANKQQKESDLLNAGDETLFIPTNPLDTKVFGVSGNPYAKKDIINTQQALRTVLVRAMTFLGYSNDQDYLTAGEDGEIQTMAKLEARMLYDALLNPTVKSLFNKIEQDNIKKTIGKISGSDRYVIGETTRGDYYYNYVNKEDGGLLNDFKLLPIGFDIEGEDLETAYQSEPFARTYIEQDKLREYASSGKIFLTNYGGGLNALGSDSVDNAKSNDGGIYIEIKQPSDIIPTTTESLYDTNLKTEMVLDLKALKEDSIASAGFNVFGGNYGISDYSNINFGEEFKTSQPKSMFIFYEQNSILNGLGLSRKASKNLKSDYDFNKTGNINLSNTYEERNIDIQSILETGKYKGSYAKPLHKDYGFNWSLSRNMDSSDVSYPFISQYLDISDGRRKTISLFGSKFYYFQKNNVINFYDNRQSSIAEKYVRGLLFLNTLPFKIYETGNVVNNPSGTVKNNKNNPFQVPEIRHLFDINAGFIHTPKLWVAYVGGLLWWLSEEDPKVSGTKIIGGGRGKTDPIIWRKDCGNDSGNWACKPTKNQYLPKMLMLDPEDIESDSILLNLPRQVQDKFKEVFFEFINGEGETSFTNIASKLEIYDGTGLGFCNLVNRFSQPDLPNTFIKKTNVSSNYVKGSDITDNFKNYDNYNVILPVYSDIGGAEYLSSIYLELKDDSDIVGKLKDIFKEELIIVNTGYKIWNPKKYAQYRQGVTIKKDVYGEYFKTFTEEIKALTEGTTIQGEEEKQLNEVFGMSNKNDIKLMLYKHCKNIYDKWVGGVQDINNVIFQCGDNSRTDSNRKQTDTALSDKYGSGKPRLIDSFRFVTRSFRDIGDELFIDPRPVEEQISDFPNTSSYSVISGLLNDNKFEFHSLPTFINYRDDEMLQSVFTPQEYGNSITSCGPTFVCVYTGQHSKSLDIKSGRYPNDGFDMRCNSTTIPDDFKNALQPYEDPVAVFEVNYSQQNQNIFKDITLDQSEFSETEESLKIVQDISMNGFENKPTYAGQNMYNIYGVRSYSAEIEMLGNPMIQPMMYFQLNNIPMFHGAYMIIRTRHNIKPNHMTTWFTGSRIRAIETPLFDVADAYMSLIETLDLSEVKGGSTTVRGSFPPIVTTIIENGGSNGNVEEGNISLVDVGEIKGVQQNVVKERRKMIAEGVPALTEMLTAFVEYAKSQEYPTINGNYVGITSLYRNYAYQQELYDDNIKNGGKPGAVAKPGTSNHSWGIAVDLLFAPQKDGSYFKKGAWGPISTDASSEGFNLEYNPSLKWFLDNSYKYGFIIPQTLRDKSSVEEYWHFEYHGTSAKCLYEKYPTTYGYTPKITANYKPVVKNPKGKDGVEAKYVGCDFKTINKNGDSVIGNRQPKESIPCNAVKKTTVDFKEILKLVVDYLEGAYCKGGSDCGSSNSGETLWGLDRKNHTGSLDSAFWKLVDQNKTNKWNRTTYPKPKDEPIIFNKYYDIIKLDYDNFTQTYLKNNNVKQLINSDGRLLFNMIYATYNGVGWFQGFAKLLEKEYNSGKTTSDELLKVFVNDRVSGGYGARPNTNDSAASLIANTGVDIQKLVGLSPLC